jgi:hypothetical protein
MYDTYVVLLSKIILRSTVLRSTEAVVLVIDLFFGDLDVHGADAMTPNDLLHTVLGTPPKTVLMMICLAGYYEMVG